MLKGFGNFLLKELKELIRDPKILLGMIIVPLIIFPIMGGVMSLSIQSAQEKITKSTVLAIDNDGGNYSEILLDALNISFRVSIIRNMTINKALVEGLLTNYTQIIEIPAGFSQNVTEYLSGNKSVNATLNFYGVFAGSGMFESIGSSVIDAFIESMNRIWAPNVISVEKSTIIKGNIVEVDPSQLSNIMMSQAFVMPITIMILLQVSMQIAATSVAMEKEEKTLETLLTLPMDRFAILMGKLSGSIIVAAIGALAFMAGFNYYMNSYTGMIPSEISVDLVSLGLVPSTVGYLLLGTALFTALLSALALAIVISAFAEDVRSAQALVGYIYPFIFIPSFLLVFLDVNSLPLALKIFVYAIPYSHPIITSKAVIVGDYMSAVLGIVYVSIFTVGILYIASRLFATEKILTAKLKFKGIKGFRKKRAEELQ